MRIGPRSQITTGSSERCVDRNQQLGHRDHHISVPDHANKVRTHIRTGFGGHPGRWETAVVIGCFQRVDRRKHGVTGR
jgi:hypothetical protein